MQYRTPQIPSWTNDLLYIVGTVIAVILLFTNGVAAVEAPRVNSDILIGIFVPIMLISLAFRYFWYTKPYHKPTNTDAE